MGLAIVVMVCMVAALVGGYILGWTEHKRAQLPYTWTCKENGCDFHVGSTDPEITLKLADTHEKVHP